MNARDWDLLTGCLWVHDFRKFKNIVIKNNININDIYSSTSRFRQHTTIFNKLCSIKQHMLVKFMLTFDECDLWKKEGGYPLFWVVENNDMYLLKIITNDKRFHVNEIVWNNLFYSYNKRRYAIFSELLKLKKWNVNRARYDKNLFILMCQNNNLDLIKEMVEHTNLDVNKKYTINSSLMCGLELAIKHNSYDVVKYLLSNWKTNISYDYRRNYFYNNMLKQEIKKRKEIALGNLCQDMVDVVMSYIFTLTIIS